jgi:hypothetical protein
MTTTTPLIWDNPIKLPDEHRLFKLERPYTNLKGIGSRLSRVPAKLLSHENGMWAVADNSGHFPQDTDDGILWLDFTSNLMVPASSSPGVPLINPIDGKGCSFVTNTAGAIVLSDMFRWTMNVNGQLFRTVRW